MNLSTAPTPYYPSHRFIYDIALLLFPLYIYIYIYTTYRCYSFHDTTLPRFHFIPVHCTVYSVKCRPHLRNTSILPPHLLPPFPASLVPRYCIGYIDYNRPSGQHYHVIGVAIARCDVISRRDVTHKRLMGYA